MQPGKNPQNKTRNGFLSPQSHSQEGRVSKLSYSPHHRTVYLPGLPCEARIDQTYLSTSFLPIYFLAIWGIFSLTCFGLCQTMGWLCFPNIQWQCGSLFPLQWMAPVCKQRALSLAFHRRAKKVKCFSSLFTHSLCISVGGEMSESKNPNNLPPPWRQTQVHTK